MTLGELVFNLGFKADTMKLKDFGKAVSELNMSSILTAGSFGAVYEGAKALVGIADDMALGINKFGRETGQSREEIQKWTKAAEQMGVAPQTVMSSITSLEDSINRMRVTGEGSGFWNLIGVDPTKTQSMFKVMDMVRNRLKGMSIENQRLLLNMSPIDPQWLNLFNESDKDWADIEKNQGLSNEQLDKMQEYHKILTKDGENLKLIWADLGVALLPAIQAMVELLNDFDLAVLKSWEFKGVLDTIVEIMTHLAHPFKTFGDALNAIPKLGTNLQEDGLERKNRINRWVESVIPHDYFSKMFSSGNEGSAPVNVTVKNTIRSNDPHTTVETTTDQDKSKKAISDVVNQMSGGTY